MLNSKQRATLRKMSNNLQPIAQIGKGGITQALIESLDKTLESRELVKVTVLETAMLDTKEALTTIATALNAEEVQAVGFKFVIYRKAKKDSKIEI